MTDKSKNGVEYPTLIAGAHEEAEGHRIYLAHVFADGHYWGTHKECSCHHDIYDDLRAGKDLEMGDYVSARDQADMDAQIAAYLAGTGPGVHVLHITGKILDATEYEHAMCNVLVVTCDLIEKDTGYRKPEGDRYENLASVGRQGRNMSPALRDAPPVFDSPRRSGRRGKRSVN